MYIFVQNAKASSSKKNQKERSRRKKNVISNIKWRPIYKRYIIKQCIKNDLKV